MTDLHLYVAHHLCVKFALNPPCFVCPFACPASYNTLTKNVESISDLLLWEEFFLRSVIPSGSDLVYVFVAAAPCLRDQLNRIDRSETEWKSTSYTF